MTDMAENIEKRAGVMARGAVADVRLMLMTINLHVEDIRLRMTRVEERLDKLTATMPELVVNTAGLREGAANIQFEARETKAVVAELRRELPALVTAALREE